MSLSPQRVDFEKIWAGLQDGLSKIVTLTGVKGMPMVEYVSEIYSIIIQHLFATHSDPVTK